MEKAVIYARYSSDKQTEQSIEGQIRVCKEYAKSHSIRIEDMYIDRAMTGTNDHRIEFQRMLKDSSKHKWQYVLVYKLDRFSRNKYETAIHKKTLKDNGVKILSATENIPESPEGIILESLLEGMAEYYSAELSQKVFRGMKESRLKGQFTGGLLPYGYNVKDKHVFINKEEAPIVREIFSMYIRKVPIIDIVSNLNARGINRLKDKPFNEGVIRALLGNEKYIGISRVRDEVYTNIFPPIIDKKVFRYTQQIAAEKRHSSRKTKEPYLFSKIMKCGYCGKTMFGVNGTAKNGNTYKYYSCCGVFKKDGCTKENVKKNDFENFVIGSIKHFLSIKKNLLNLSSCIVEQLAIRQNNNEILNNLLNKKSEINSKIDNLLNAITSGIVTPSTKSLLSKLDAELEQIELSIEIEKNNNKNPLDQNMVIDFFKKVIKSTPLRFVRILIKRIVIFDDKVQVFCNYNSNENITNLPELNYICKLEDYQLKKMHLELIF